MPTLGTTGKPSGGWFGFGGSSQVNQIAEILTAPSRLRILEVGQWVGGWEDAPRARLCVWHATTKALLGQSAQITVTNEGALGGGQVSLYTEVLETPVEIAKGVSFYVGVTRHPDDDFQLSTGASGSGPHYRGRSGAAWPNSLGNAGSYSEEPRRIGAYVANYENLPGAWVYRSGAWVEADTVQAYRSGSWADVDGVQIYRGGSWTDSE